MKNLKQLLTTTILALTFLLAAGLLPAIAANPPQVSMLTPVSSGLRTPVRVITDAAGYIYIADPRAGGVVKLAQDGFPALPASLIKTDRPPTGIAITAKGDLLVTQGSYVQVFTFNPASTGNVTAFSYSKGLQFGSFQMANGIAIAADGTIFISDSLDHKVYRFNSQYTQLGSFGTQGSGDGQFNLPTALAYDKAGNQLIVVDTLNGRLQFFTTAGSFVRKIGSRGTDPNAIDDAVDSSVFFSAPQGVSLEYTRTAPEQLSRIYVTDSYQSRVQVIDPAGSGQRLRYIGNYGTPQSGVTYPSSTAAQFKLIHPSDVAFDHLNNRILVANGFGNLVVFGIDGGTTPTPTTITKPRVTFTLPPTIISQNNFTLSGTVDQPATISVSPDGTANAPNCIATFSDVSHWSCTVSGLTENILYNFVLKAAPLSGNNDTNLVASTTFPVKYLQAAPLFSLSSFTSPTAASQITISGTTGANKVTVTNTGDNSSADATITGQNWSITLPLPSAQNTFSVYLNNGTDPVQTFSVERIMLSPSLVTAPASTNVTTAVQNVSGSINGVSEVTVTVNGAATPVTVPVVNGVFSTAVTLQNGDNTIAINAKDANGTSISPAQSFNYVFDPTKPSVTVTDVTNGSTPVQDSGSISRGNLTFSGTAPAGATVSLIINGGSPIAVTNTAGIWTYAADTTNTTAFPNGLHTFIFTVNDNGNLSSIKQSFIIVATTAPQISLKVADDSSAPFITYKTDAQTNLQTVHLNGSAANAVAVGVTLNGANLPVAFDAVNGTYTVSMPVTFGANGPQTIVATAYAADGNSATVTRTIILDQTPPQVVGTIGTLQPSNDLQIRVSSGLVDAFFYATPGDPTSKTSILATGTTANGITTFVVAPTSINVGTLTFIDNAGNTSRNGRISGGTGEPTVLDAITALKLSVHGITATTENMMYGDVAPFSNKQQLPDGRYKYTSTPDGKIDIDDVRAILYRAVGLVTW